MIAVESEVLLGRVEEDTLAKQRNLVSRHFTPVSHSRGGGQEMSACNCERSFVVARYHSCSDTVHKLEARDFFQQRIYPKNNCEVSLLALSFFQIHLLFI